MEEHKSHNKVSRIIILLVIAVTIIIAILGYLMYSQKVAADKQIADLKRSEAELQATVAELQGKFESINEISNTENESKNIAQKSENESENELLEGKYSVKGIELGPDIENYGIESIKINPSNQFEIFFPLGTSYTGTYNIDGQNIICSATKEHNQEGNFANDTVGKNANITFYFQTIDSKTIKYIESTNKSLEFTKDMNYTLD